MIAVRVQDISKVEYNYFNKGNFSLGKVEEAPKQIPGLKPEASTSLFNLPKIFTNQLYEILTKPGS